ncbi:class I SAM-dependent methyltransferase [Amycolatopsis sp. NPDC005003]
MTAAPIDGAGLDGVAATCLWTLRNRAEESRHPGSAFADPLAERLQRGISYDYAKFGKPDQIHALRAAALDCAIRAYLDRHPAATVVALGEGLQTTYWRLGRPAVDWLSVDLPPVADLRRRLLPAEPRMSVFEGSALDRSWLEVPDPARGVFISAEGLFMYFERAEVLALIADCAARFPGGQLFFDSIPPWLSRRTLRGGPARGGGPAPGGGRNSASGPASEGGAASEGGPARGGGPTLEGGRNSASGPASEGGQTSSGRRASETRPRGRPPFSTLPATTDNSGLRLSARYTAPPMPFGLTVSEAARLPGRIPGVAAVEDVQPPPGRKAWRSGTLRKLADLPGLRDLRPSISLVTFG